MDNKKSFLIIEGLNDRLKKLDNLANTEAVDKEKYIESAKKSIKDIVSKCEKRAGEIIKIFQKVEDLYQKNSKNKKIESIFN